MKLKLKNIGTLKQAEIDLSKDLIILAGPNNTGKTYAAYTVYGVCEMMKSEDWSFKMSKSFGELLSKYRYNWQKQQNVINITHLCWSNILKVF
jgi:predicted ATPase